MASAVFKDDGRFPRCAPASTFVLTHVHNVYTDTRLLRRRCSKGVAAMSRPPGRLSSFQEAHMTWPRAIIAALGVLAFLLAAIYPLALLVALCALGCWRFVFSPINARLGVWEVRRG